MTVFARPPDPIDLSTCDREPIHTPSLIQPHGLLLALDPATGRVAQASANAGEILDRPLERVLGASLADLVGEGRAEMLEAALQQPALSGNPTNLGPCRLGRDGPRINAIGHRVGEIPVLEFELTRVESPRGFAELSAIVQAFMPRLQALGGISEILAYVSGEIRRITGFDRVLVYRFDPQWNGTVVAEDRNDRLPSYLDLRFPASDIPRQARELYRLNRLRLIADADYEPVPLVPTAHPATGSRLDMSYCSLRSVSPVHLEYMRNMGTRSSMSISIVQGGALWGLISCHGAEPRRVPFEARLACDFLAQVLSLELASRERSAQAEQRIRLNRLEGVLLAHMARADSFEEGLASDAPDFLSFADATGGAIVTPEGVRLVGDTPPPDAVRDLVQWLADHREEEVFASHELPARYPPAAAYGDKAAGLLAFATSELHPSFVLWFRPEVVRTVQWAGDPRKPTGGPVPGEERLHPRRSFELWKQEVRHQSLPWSAPQIEAAADLRRVIVGIVLRKAEEVAELSHELEVANKDLEAFSYSVSHDLRAPFRHIVGYSELLRELESEGLSERGRRYVETIIESAQYAGQLVDHLLQFSRMNRSTLERHSVDLNRLVREVRSRLQREATIEGRSLEWQVGRMPTVQGDLFMLRLVIENLLSNAVKYTRPRRVGRIEIGSRDEPGRWVMWVRDNGVGFDMKYLDKLFGVFQRLHRMEDFEGTGIGLATVRRIIARHGGEAWAEGEVDRGATLYFTLPKPQTGSPQGG